MMPGQGQRERDVPERLEAAGPEIPGRVEQAAVQLSMDAYSGKTMNGRNVYRMPMNTAKSPYMKDTGCSVTRATSAAC